MSLKRMTILIAGLSLLLWETGCKPASTSRQSRQVRQNKSKISFEQDHLRDMSSYLLQIAEVDETVAAEQISFHLNSWLEKAKPTVNWAPPARLSRTLPTRQITLFSEIGAKQFSPADLEHLRLCFILNRISRWATEGPSIDPLLTNWLKEQQEKLSPEAFRDLDLACRLFDWTVRNVVLEPFLLDQKIPTPQLFPSEIAFRGPGYRQTTLETVWHGTGDAWQRARVFIQLCRQLEIDACMVGLRDGSQLAIWLCAARVGDELYLFEPQLGLPVPGPEQYGVATLTDALRDASVTRRLNVPGWFEYPFQKAQLKDCVAALDTTPEASSWRMKALEEALTGDLRMKLTSDIEAVGDRLLKCKGINDIGLWSVPMDAIVHQAALKRARGVDPELDAFFSLEYGMLFSGGPLAKARWDHLLGRFEKDDREDIVGAQIGYQKLRVTESDIEKLPFDVRLQILNGVRRTEGEEAEHFQFKIQLTQQIMRKAKLASSFWMGQMMLDQHRFEVAPPWLLGRYLEGGGDKAAWSSAARYSLARAYEWIGRLDDAINLYKTEGSLQEHGNRIRARLLAKESPN